MQNRIILFHKQSSSARIRFLYFSNRNSVLGFESLPNLASLIEKSTDSLNENAQRKQLNEFFGDVDERVIIDDDFHYNIDVPGEIIGVALARFTDIDPPFELAQKVNAKFCEITAARSVSPVELELLQKAYTQIMG